MQVYVCRQPCRYIYVCVYINTVYMDVLLYVYIAVCIHLFASTCSIICLSFNKYFFFKKIYFIYVIFGCVGSSLLRAGFL